MATEAGGPHGNSFTPALLLSLNICRVPRPAPVRGNFQGAGVTRRPGSVFPELRGRLCQGQPPPGGLTGGTAPASHFLCCPPSFLQPPEALGETTEKDAACSPPEGTRHVPADGQAQLVFFISTSAAEEPSCQHQPPGGQPVHFSDSLCGFLESTRQAKSARLKITCGFFRACGHRHSQRLVTAVSLINASLSTHPDFFFFLRKKPTGI